MVTKEKFDNLLKKIETMNEKGTVDLSTEEDLSLAIMNLVSLEEHYFFTGVKTGKKEYYNLLDEVRKLRQELLAMIIDKNEGETWCITKHLLAATMRLIEVATKLQSTGKVKEAEAMFQRAYKVYVMFWGVRLNLINSKTIKKKDVEQEAWSLDDIVSKMVDCCDEK